MFGTDFRSAPRPVIPVMRPMTTGVPTSGLAPESPGAPAAPGMIEAATPQSKTPFGTGVVMVRLLLNG